MCLHGQSEINEEEEIWEKNTVNVSSFCHSFCAICDRQPCLSPLIYLRESLLV